MKSLFVVSHSQGIINDMVRAVNNFSEIELVGTGLINEETKQQCSFSQPDFIVSELLNLDTVIEFLELCNLSNILMVTDDINRGNAIVNDLQNRGYYRVQIVDANLVSPMSLCQAILSFKQEENFVEEKNVSDMFNESKVLTLDDLESVDKPLDNGALESSSEDNIQTDIKTVENKNDVANEVKNNVGMTVRRDAKNEVFNLNVNNLRSKSISLFSKKGGTGKTNIIKELANIYSSVKLPKKLQNGNEYLTCCTVDFDFDRGNLRTYYGIDNPTPNVYLWMNDILDRIENKTPISKINYNSFEVMRYVKKVTSDGNYYTLITAQGGIPARTLYRISALDNDGNLLCDIIKIIIQSLKKAFDVVLFDMDNDFNEITRTILSVSDNILYILTPSVADVENLKAFNDEIEADSEHLVNLDKFAIVLNKFSKSITYKNDLLDVLSLVKYKGIDFATGKEVEKNFKIISDIAYNPNIPNYNNGYLFTTNASSQEFKKGYLKTCEYCLPIFKVKYTSSGLAELEKLQKKKKQQEKKKMVDKKTSNALKSVEDFKKDAVKDTKSAMEPSPDSTKTKEKDDVPYGDPTMRKMGANKYLASDLSQVTMEDFVERLKEYQDIYKTVTGFPLVYRKPPLMNKKVWKQYDKQRIVEMNLALKIKRTENK